MTNKKLCLLAILLFVLGTTIHPVMALSYVDLERTTVGTQTEGSYPPYIVITDLEASYETKLYNATNDLITNATAEAQGTANMTIPEQYLSSAFEGTFRLYDSNSSFLYSKWFEDIHGGDEYAAQQDSDVAMALGAFAFIMAVVGVTLFLTKKREDQTD